MPHNPNKPRRDRTLPPRVADASGLDSIFAGARDPTTAELQQYWQFAGAKGPPLVNMLGSAFLTQADADAYLAYARRVSGG